MLNCQIFSLRNKREPVYVTVHMTVHVTVYVTVHVTVYVKVFLFSWSVISPVLLQPECVTAVTRLNMG
jgi:hypothetical protein